MSESELRTSIERLRAEIERLSRIEDADRARLETIVADLEHRLAHPGDAARHHDLVRDVREAIAHFEVEHPTATGILNHVMITLGNMGI